MKPWQRVRAFARRHGVKFFIVPATDLRIAYTPFSSTVGLSWGSKKLFISRDHLHNAETIGNAIHELGHLLALREIPSRSIEQNSLGWEWQVAKLLRIRRQWEINMNGYGVEAGGSYGGYSTKEKLEILRSAVEDGKKYGNLTATGCPIVVR